MIPLLGMYICSDSYVQYSRGSNPATVNIFLGTFASGLNTNSTDSEMSGLSGELADERHFIIGTCNLSQT